MAKLSLDEFKNFFKYYREEEHQVEAIESLYFTLENENSSVLQSDTAWVRGYRNQSKIKHSVSASGCVSKQQMARIMGCAVSSLSDELMNDYARCVQTFGMDKLSQIYFLGQCGHESAGLRYPVEIHDGSNYEWRRDLGNVHRGDGVKFAGTGWIQVTGRFNHQAFSDYLESIGQADPRVMEEGKQYTSNVYPWTISGFWWHQNKMNEFCSERTEVTNVEIDEVGAKVNGRMRPNGADDRIKYTDLAYWALQ